MEAIERIKVNITLEVTRAKFIELEKEYSKDLSVKLIDSKVIPNTDHLKDDPTFKGLIKKEQELKRAKYEYINKNSK